MKKIKDFYHSYNNYSLFVCSHSKYVNRLYACLLAHVVFSIVITNCASTFKP
jgi:hypothetical protein